MQSTNAHNMLENKREYARSMHICTPSIFHALRAIFLRLGEDLLQNYVRREYINLRKTPQGKHLYT